MTNFKLFTILKAVALVPMDDDELGAAIADGVATTITLDTGQGVAYANASVTKPDKIMIENEIMYVTGRSTDTLTVIRGRDGTTAAAHADASVVKHLTSVRLPKASAFTITPDVTTVDFPGDGDVEQVFVAQSVSGQLTLTKYATDVLKYVAGITEVTAGLPTDEAVRHYPQQGTYPDVELQVDFRGHNDTTGLNGTVRATIFQAKLQDPVVPAFAGNIAAEASTYAWSSTATMVDLFGRALPGVTEDVNFALSVLA